MTNNSPQGAAWRRALLLFALLLPLLASGAVSAQADGQFCVQAFEDRNGSGSRDAGEPFLQRSVSANLIDANGIIIASALLDNAPNETRVNGVICFQFLAPGQYAMEVTSAEFRATTPTTLTVTLNAGDIPAVLDFGAQSRTTGLNVGTTSVQPDREAAIMRLAVSAAGAAAAAVGMALFGVLLYFIGFRRR